MAVCVFMKTNLLKVLSFGMMVGLMEDILLNPIYFLKLHGMMTSLVRLY